LFYLVDCRLFIVHSLVATYPLKHLPIVDHRLWTSLLLIELLKPDFERAYVYPVYFLGQKFPKITRW